MCSVLVHQLSATVPSSFSPALTLFRVRQPISVPVRELCLRKFYSERETLPDRQKWRKNVTPFARNERKFAKGGYIDCRINACDDSSTSTKRMLVPGMSPVYLREKKQCQAILNPTTSSESDREIRSSHSAPPWLPYTLSASQKGPLSKGPLCTPVDGQIMATSSEAATEWPRRHRADGVSPSPKDYCYRRDVVRGAFLCISILMNPSSRLLTFVRKAASTAMISFVAELRSDSSVQRVFEGDRRTMLDNARMIDPSLEARTERCLDLLILLPSEASPMLYIY